MNTSASSKNPSNHSSKTVLITGASGGIGLELARCFAADHYDLVLTSRDEEKLRLAAQMLEQEYSASVTTLAFDLSQPGSASQLFAELQQKQIEISALVNNAGFGDYGFFADCELEKQEQMIAVNIAALTQLTRLFLPAMIGRKSGHILNLASTAAFFPGPLMSVYFASKAYVLSFSQALSNELQNSGVTCSCLCPGPTQTDFQNRAAMRQSRLMQGAMMDAKTVAQIGYDGLNKGRNLIVAGRWNRILIQAQRIFSQKQLAKIIRGAQ